jgi:vacuolar iron transporter family protein
MVVVVLGIANLVADGLCMAVSNYLGTKSERERIENIRAAEDRHIEQIPEGEREEIRQIFASKGFAGEVLVMIPPSEKSAGKSPPLITGFPA